MKVLVVGSGGREHAIVWKLAASRQVERIYCAPGNAGTAEVAANLAVDATDLEGLLDVARTLGIDLTVVGPEAPLAAGIVDLFLAQGLRIFGPTRAAARLESSKAWTKELLLRHAIPTGRAEIVESEAAARRALARSGLPAVVKADGLAGGKGVWVCQCPRDVDGALEALFQRRALGAAGDRALIEEYLAGPELSVLAFADGERLALMPPARDYKRLLDGDRGPNTGGMGGYTRPADATPDLLARVEAEVLRPTLAAVAGEGAPYRGVLYAGLMLTDDGPRVLEFNCRLGDPEAQLILPLLESDFLDACLSVAEGRLRPETLQWSDGASCGVVLAAEGYPGRVTEGAGIHGLDAVPRGVLVFHAGTRAQPSRQGGSVMAAGGRVLCLVAQGPDVASAREQAYAAVPVVHFEGRQYRSDIGLEPPPRPTAGSPRPSLVSTGHRQ